MKVRRCPIIAASTPSSLRAQRSNPGATARGPWIASSQGLLAMTDGVIHVPQVDFLSSGRLLRRLESERSEATQGLHHPAPGLLRRFVPRNDDSDRSDTAPTGWRGTIYGTLLGAIIVSIVGNGLVLLGFSQYFGVATGLL